jgi:RimJ/RimL family protein N-acetyltransferase/GNAT superfamily N-acetyltransferase
VSGLTIRKIDPAEIEVLKEALPKFRFTPLSHLPYLKRSQIEAFWMDEIRETTADATSATFVAGMSDRIVGFAIYTESPWDSRVVGRRIGALKYLAADTENLTGARAIGALVEQSVDYAGTCGTECLTAKVHPRDTPTIHALERNGFLLMDTLVYHLFDFSRMSFDRIRVRRPAGFSSRLAQPEDLPEMLEIAERAFKNHFGRYNADPRMPHGAARHVYREWVRSSLGAWAQWVIIAEVRGKIVGYAVWKRATPLEAKHGLDLIYYNLIAIHPHFAGRGVFAALSYDSMQMLRDHANHLVAPTHVSHNAVHHMGFEFGWQLGGARHSFHKWLTP